MLNYSDVAELFEEIELRLIASLKRNLARHKDEENKEGFNWSAWQAEKLKHLAQFRRENSKILGEYQSKIDEQTRQLMVEQFKEGEELVNSQLGFETDVSDLVNDENFFGINTPKMQSLIKDITELEKNVETAALRMTDDVYRRTVNLVQLEMASGSMTLTQATDNAVKDFLSKGINCIVYSNGRRVNIADYVRMALRTTSTRATLQGKAKAFAELGYDTVMTSQYAMCSETCLPYQGKVYIDDVFTVWSGETYGKYGKSNYCGKWFMLLSYAIENGLFHPNCRHTLLQYIDGMTKKPKLIPAKEVKRRRELEQRQRAYERDIRKLKRLVAGTQDPDTVKEYKKKLHEKQKQLRDFINETNTAEGKTILKRENELEKVYDKEAVSINKNVNVQGGFFDSQTIAQDIKNEIIRCVEKAQSEYNVIVDEISLEDISSQYGKTAFQFYPINDNGAFKSKLIINEGFNWEENLDKMNERIYNKNYKKGILSSKNVEDLIYHEMAHFMSFQDCKTYADFLNKERELYSLYIPGVSEYADAMKDGSETLAEGFVRMKNGDSVDERVQSLVEMYVERWRK